MRWGRSWMFALRRRFGQTRWAHALKRRRRSRLRIPRALPPDPALLRPFPPDEALAVEVRDRAILATAKAWAERRGGGRQAHSSCVLGAERSGPGRISNVLFISHSDFTGNSAWHVLAIASELRARGLSPVIAIPDDVASAREVGNANVPIVELERVLAEPVRFPDGRGPDVVHAFTPRELVREATSAIVARTGCPYVLHLEDNDAVILSAELGLSVAELERLPAVVLDSLVGPSRFHPLRGRRFLECAAGTTVVTERLGELVPPELPVATVKPGFDEAILRPARERDDVRAELELRADDFAIAYTGSVHAANAAEVHTLYAAVAALRADGHPVVLVKTGWDGPEVQQLPALGAGIRNLGRVPRSFIPALLAAADVLAQPGAPGDFDDYRFPAKLPDFLASGRPVILPRTNIGLELHDGHDALLLDRGGTEELCRAILRLRQDPALAAAIGQQGRDFALRELRWSKSVDNVQSLYDDVARSQRRRQPRWALELDPPVKVIALVEDVPSAAHARSARAHGVYGFCVPPATVDSAIPFCFRVQPGDDLDGLANAASIAVGGAPLLLAAETAGLAQLRARAEQESGGRVHIAAMGGVTEADSVVEAPVAPTASYELDAAMREQLAAPLPDHVWFRSLAFPVAEEEARRTYEIWLRKLVLQTVARSAAQEPFVFVVPGEDHDAWLAATRSALVDGVTQFYSSQGLDVSPRAVERLLSLA